MTNWISVDERLPKAERGTETENVLVYCEDKGCIQGFYCHGDGEWYDMDGDPISMHSVDEATHWMPLPEKPEANQ